MDSSVTFVEINLFDQMLPLSSGYMQSYACLNNKIKSTFEFHKYTATVHSNDNKIYAEILKNKSEVYALSCYLWNIRIMLRIADKIIETQPEAYVLMGGPQVMHHAHQYLDSSKENLLICNGEGEITFSEFLSETCAETPDFSKVKGLSFFKDGSLVTTEPQTRLKSLNDIPSPYLNGVFDGKYRMAVMETNRGCPFRCSYCYWGAATNDKVHKFEEQRLTEEINWLGENRVPILYLADANWGMLKRDIKLSDQIANSKKEHGMPIFVYFSAAKNSPDRVSTVAKVFNTAGMMNNQPVSLQTMNKTALEAVDRSNIKPELYQQLQNELNEKGISSFVELIWPLPGETLSSFKNGLEELCEMNAASIIAYPNLLLHNTPMYKQRDELGIVTKTVTDHASEAELIVETKQVSNHDFKQGLLFFYTTLALYNTRAVGRSLKWLHNKKLCSYASFFEEFKEFCKANESNTFTSFCNDSITNDKYYEISNYPTVYYITLHKNRAEFDSLLFRFCAQNNWWNDDDFRFLFELDLITKLYLYSNTPINTCTDQLEIINIAGVEDRTIIAEIPDDYLWHLKSEEKHDNGTIRLNHAREQFPYDGSQPVVESAQYSAGRIQLIHSTVPLWELSSKR